MNAVLWALLVLAALGGVLVGVFQDRRAEPKPDVDGPHRLDTADPIARREVHGMTVPELMETRERFAELIGREWPDQT
jgi:hypothetical protein